MKDANERLAEDIRSVIEQSPEKRVAISYLKRLLTGNRDYGAPASGRRWKNINSGGIGPDGKYHCFDDTIEMLGFAIITEGRARYVVVR